MAWDLAVSENGDFVFAAHRDLAGVSGTDLIEQRIRLRLRIVRGSWVFDTDKTLGSYLHQLVGMNPVKASGLAPAYVREALRTMTEISVDDVLLSYTDRDLTLEIRYHVLLSPGQPNAGATEQERSISVTLAGAGGD